MTEFGLDPHGWKEQRSDCLVKVRRHPYHRTLLHEGFLDQQIDRQDVNVSLSVAKSNNHRQMSKMHVLTVKDYFRPQLHLSIQPMSNELDRTTRSESIKKLLLT